MTNHIHVNNAVKLMIPEANIQEAVISLLQWHGWLVIEISMHQRVEGSLIGVPDVCAMKDGITWWIELKTVKGKLRKSQVEFAELLKPHLCGTIWYTVARCVDDVAVKLPNLGYAQFYKESKE